MSLPLGIQEKYELLSKIREGGMGSVFKVRHRLLDDVRVIKVIRPQHAGNTQLRARFLTEAQATTRLRHPNIAQVFDFAVDADGAAYLVMEFIEGMTLETLVSASDHLPLAASLEIAAQGLVALQYLHEQGYIHRDISPDNLMLTRNFDGLALLKVIDLGLAKRLATNESLTTTGMFVGKARYTSPEQFGGQASQSGPLGDLYSFGIVLYELLTGVCPIRGSEFEELVAAQLVLPLPSFEETDPQGKVPKGLRAVLLKALQRKPEDRMASASEFLNLLAPFRSGQPPRFAQLARFVDPTMAKTPSPTSTPTLFPERTEPGRRARDLSASERRLWRRPLGWALAAVASMVLVLLVAQLPQWPQWRSSRNDSRATASRPGTVLLDATPWAEIIAITGEQGAVATSARFTPASFTLPAGNYEIELAGPEPDSLRTIRISIAAGESVAHSEELGRVSVDDYFEQAGLRSLLEEAGR